MHLSDLESYHPITIQTHDNPDADAIASGYALYIYFKSKGHDVSLIYGGRYQIQKTNLQVMIDKLQIPIIYREADNTKIEGLLITVDCQYGAGNVYRFQADNIAVIDHHQKEINTTGLVDWEIASNLGSCSTLVWKMMKAEGYPVEQDSNLGTALYYGLYRDTNQFSEMFNPLDMDMREDVLIDKDIINQLRNSNLSLKELEIAGVALIRYSYNNEFHYAIIQAQPCDPNLLGLISDFLIQVDEIKACVVYNAMEDGYKYSVRSCVKEVRASELARFLSNQVGSGGGHVEKAGGFISKKKYEQLYPSKYSEVYFGDKMNEYFESFDIMDARNCNIEISNMKQYIRKNMPTGYVKADKIFKAGTPVVIRTLEGDVDMQIDENLYIMISMKGEVYSCSREEFDSTYKLLKQQCMLNLEYTPRIKNKITGNSLELMEEIHFCTFRNKTRVYARQLTRGIKIFTKKYEDTYMLGYPGDYLVAKCDDLHDIYVVEKESFQETYQEIRKGKRENVL